MEESHAKLRDRLCLEDRLSAARGLYLQGSACCSEARVLFKCFPFGECGNPATLVVWRFQNNLIFRASICESQPISMISNGITQWIFAWFRRADGNIRYRPFVIRHTIIPCFSNSYYSGCLGIFKIIYFPGITAFLRSRFRSHIIRITYFRKFYRGGYYQN